MTFRDAVSRDLLAIAKEAGFSDKQVGSSLGLTELEARGMREKQDLKPWVKQVWF